MVLVYVVLIKVDAVVLVVGQIDGIDSYITNELGDVFASSVLTAVGLFLMFSVIAKIPEAIKAGKTVKISKGDFTAEVGAEPNE